jgi:hypothetical protein
VGEFGKSAVHQDGFHHEQAFLFPNWSLVTTDAGGAWFGGAEFWKR